MAQRSAELLKLSLRIPRYSASMCQSFLFFVVGGRGLEVDSTFWYFRGADVGRGGEVVHFH